MKAQAKQITVQQVEQAINILVEAAHRLGTRINVGRLFLSLHALLGAERSAEIIGGTAADLYYLLLGLGYELTDAPQHFMAEIVG